MPDLTSGARTSAMASTPVQKAALAVAAAFALIGIAGFIPGITTNYDAMELAGDESRAQLFGIFQMSILHNVVHLLFAIVGFALARSWSGARAFLIGGGLVYAVLWLYGLFVDKRSEANFVPLDRADDWLHLVLAIAMVSLGVLLGGLMRGRGSLHVARH